MFGDHCTAGRDDKHAGRGDIEQIELVPAGATDIDRRGIEAELLDLRIYRPTEEGRDKKGNLSGTFPLGSESLEKGHLCFHIGRFIEEKVHDCIDLMLVEFLSGAGLADESVHDFLGASGLGLSPQAV